MHTLPFHADRYVFAPFTLAPLQPMEAESIAHQLAMIDPWKRLGYGAPGLSRYLTAPDSSLKRFLAKEEAQSIAVVCVRFPWLRGPYLELLAVVPSAQGRGVGRRLLSWMEQETRNSANNLWTVTSEFNTRARNFYRTAGFVEVAPLPGLVKKGYNELLLRKTISKS